MRIQFHIHGFGQFDRNHAIGPCVWPHFDLLTVHRGSVWMNVLKGERIELARKQSILIFPHTRFEGASRATRSEVSVMHFALAPTKQRVAEDDPLGQLAGRARGCEVYDRNVSDEVMRDIRRAVAMAHQHPAVSDSVREAMLTLIISQLAEHPRAREAASLDAAADFSALIHWMSSNLHQQVTLDDMAAFVGYSCSHFRSQFVKQVGRSPAMFLRHVRHLEAGRLLRETQRPIKEVAQRVGYEDLAHFYRFFTKISGMTPLAYRERYQLRG